MTEEQWKYLIIFGSVAGLILLVMMQAACMIYRDRRKSQNFKKSNLSHLSHPNTLSELYLPPPPPPLRPGMGNGKANGKRMMNGGGADRMTYDRISGERNAFDRTAYDRVNGDRSGTYDRSEVSGRATYERNISGERDHRGGERSANAATSSGNNNVQRHPQWLNAPTAAAPDCYFLPHQRRYSGEVVRVFVDYNNMAK